MGSWELGIGIYQRKRKISYPPCLCELPFPIFVFSLGFFFFLDLFYLFLVTDVSDFSDSSLLCQ